MVVFKRGVAQQVQDWVNSVAFSVEVVVGLLDIMDIVWIVAELMIYKEMNKGGGCTGIIYFLLLIGNCDFNERGYRQCHHDWRGINAGGIYKDSNNTKIFNEQTRL